MYTGAECLSFPARIPADVGKGTIPARKASEEWQGRWMAAELRGKMREKICWDEEWVFHAGDVDQALPAYKGAAYCQAKTERAKLGASCRFHNDRIDPYGNGYEFPDEIWEAVTLPHDYTIGQTPEKNYNNARGYFKYENAWYRKHFWVEEEDREKRICAYFEGVSGMATVYLNGCLMKRNYCGYTSFEVDLTDYLRWDEENVLAVYVDALSQHEGWWYEGSGIYRHVWLVKTDLAAVDLWGIYVHPEHKETGSWNTPVEVTVRNDFAVGKTVTVQAFLLGPDGEEMGRTVCETQIPAKEKETVHLEFIVTDPARWDIENPQFHYVEAVVFRDGEEVDRVRERFGYRTLEFNAQKGFFLNGRRVMIQGVCCHQDYGLTGRAVPGRVQRYRLKLLKEMGANGYRTSHYPQSEETMDALDELGFLVLDETRWFESTEEGLRQLEMLVKRDRNRPGVIMWSIANEEPLNEFVQGCRITTTMKAAVKKLDRTRPVTAALNCSPATGEATGLYDVIGVNYNQEDYDPIHEKYPDIPVFSSECCATGTTRGWYLPNDDKRGYIYGYDRDTNASFWGREHTWKFFLARPWIMGCYQWAGIEHRGETVWPRLCSQSGALDLYLQRKDAFYQNQSHWTTRPMVHLLPHWNWIGEEGDEKRVVVYSNCQEVELFLNGASLGTRKLEAGDHGEWTVPYQPGSLKAVGRMDGLTAACEEIATTGRPAALKLVLEDVEGGIRADGKDVAILTCYCVDEEGRAVPDVAPEIAFETNGLGAIEGTGSDICDHVPPCSPVRKMRCGLCSVLVRSGRQAGMLKVYARSQGLITGRIEIPLKEDSTRNKEGKRNEKTMERRPS